MEVSTLLKRGLLSISRRETSLCKSSRYDVCYVRTVCNLRLNLKLDLIVQVIQVSNVVLSYAKRQ